ncbi:MAG: Lrp/AsnC family transcriptional regulator [Candidatus Microthrix sp.]|nr:Lrp/AsnC family transcriptional regulator [Candidatus Microthrix sp.]
MELDDIDRALVGLLRRTGRMSYRDLGMEVALGASATADRVKRLERAGVIAGYSAVIDPETIGRTLRAAIDVRLPADGDHEGFEAGLATLDEVDLAAHVTGPFDYLILMAVAGCLGWTTSCATGVTRFWPRHPPGSCCTRWSWRISPADHLRATPGAALGSGSGGWSRAHPGGDQQPGPHRAVERPGGDCADIERSSQPGDGGDSGDVAGDQPHPGAGEGKVRRQAPVTPPANTGPR